MAKSDLLKRMQELAKRVTAVEGKKVEVAYPQVMEVLSVLGKLEAENDLLGNAGESSFLKAPARVIQQIASYHLKKNIKEQVALLWAKK